MKWTTIPILAVAAALSGCGDDLDGTYAGGTGFMQVAVMQLTGDKAVVETVNTYTKQVVVRREMVADMRKGKLHLERSDGVVFVYGLAADDMSLDCLSDSCRGGRGMPGSWSPVKQ